MRTYATQERIHGAIVQRLIDEIAEWSSSTCYTSDDPNLTLVPPHDIFCTVVPRDGVFDEAMFAGGGIDCLSERTAVAVNVFSFVRSGESGGTNAAIYSEQRGLLSNYKPRILRALLLDWEPTFDGQSLLRDMLRPVRSVGPKAVTVNKRKYLSLTLEFATHFDWEIV